MLRGVSTRIGHTHASYAWNRVADPLCSYTHVLTRMSHYFQFLIQADLFFPLYVIVANAYKKIEDKIQEYNDASPGLIMEKCEGEPKLFDGYVMWLSYPLAEVLPPPFSSQVENQPLSHFIKKQTENTSVLFLLSSTASCCATPQGVY